jgi:hypothetical protein
MAQVPCKNCEKPVEVDGLGTALSVSLDGIKQHVCCSGCQTALEDKYKGEGYLERGGCFVQPRRPKRV